MKRNSGLILWFAARLVAGGVLGASALAQDQAPALVPASERPTLAQALQAAWARAPEAARASGRTQQARAEQAVADSWLAGAPAFEATQREGRSAANSGSRETELGVALPIWRPGLRDSSQRAAQAGAEGALADEQAARLQLAGELRVLAATLRAGEAERQLAELDQQLYAQLAADVERRVRAGDLASADALAARAEALAARARAQDSALRLQARRARWQLLTGWAQAAQAEPAPGDAPGPDVHPLLRLAELERERSRARLEQVQSQSVAAPEFRFSVREEQAAQAQGSQHSVAVGLRLPFATATHRQPQLAAALAEQELAEAQAERTRAQLLSELELARTGLQAAAEQDSGARERAALLRERARLIELSFRAGESPLPELLRTLAAAAQAEAAAARQQAALELAQAQLRQALGILP